MNVQNTQTTTSATTMTAPVWAGAVMIENTPVPEFSIHTLQGVSEWLNRAKLDKISDLIETADYMKYLQRAGACRSRVEEQLGILRESMELFNPLILRGSEWRTLIRHIKDTSMEWIVINGFKIYSDYHFKGVLYKEEPFYTATLEDNSFYWLEFSIPLNSPLEPVQWKLSRYDNCSTVPRTPFGVSTEEIGFRKAREFNEYFVNIWQEDSREANADTTSMFATDVNGQWVRVPVPEFSIRDIEGVSEWLSSVRFDTIKLLLVSLRYHYDLTVNNGDSEVLSTLRGYIEKFNKDDIFKPLILRGSEWRKFLFVDEDGNESVKVNEEEEIPSYPTATVLQDRFIDSLNNESLYAISFILLSNNEVVFKLIRMDEFANYTAPFITSMGEGYCLTFAGDYRPFYEKFLEWSFLEEEYHSC